MKHLGDITKINGWEIEPVDCVTGGSPCQDLSVAGKRAGLAGARSGLFMEQVRVVKELRERDRANGRSGVLIRPRYMVWENVRGAFSSNKGQDFRAVLEEIVRIAEPDAPDVPMPAGGGWPHSGCLYDELGRWSIAWRLHDAQFWGVPQRRKRIALIADFGGLSAPEILFERKGLCWDSETGVQEKEETAARFGSGAEIADMRGAFETGDRKGEGGSAGPAAVLDGERENPDTARALTARNDGSPCIDRGPEIVIQPEAMSFQERAGKPGGGKGVLIQEEKTGALSATHEQYVAAFSGGQGEKAGGIGYQEEVAPSLKSVMSGGNTVPTIVTYDARGNGDGKTVCTITGDHENRVTDYTALCVGNGQMDNITMKPVANTLDTMHDQQAVLIAAVDCRSGTENPDTNGTLQAKENGGISINYQNTVRVNRRVRRLVPMECERLQGYPDNWTLLGELVDWTIWRDEAGNEYPDAIYKYVGPDGKTYKTSDTARYKALGNSIALPFWFWLMRRISAQYERPALLGSLFDGIGGFPLCWERCNGKGTARWASEIEPFPIAVTTYHFPEE